MLLLHGKKKSSAEAGANFLRIPFLSFINYSVPHSLSLSLSLSCIKKVIHLFEVLLAIRQGMSLYRCGDSLIIDCWRLR